MTTGQPRERARDMALKYACFAPAEPLALPPHQAWIDWTRAIATVLVVVLHTAAPLLYRYESLPASYWWCANAFDSLARACVPLFFMISGHLLLGKRESVQLFFRKRALKVVLPLLAWSGIYVAWRMRVEHSFDPSVITLARLFFEPAYYHLWFLYAILWLYLATPLMRRVIQKLHDREMRLFLVAWLMVAPVIPFLRDVLHLTSKIDPLSIAGYSGYLVLGRWMGARRDTHTTASLQMSVFMLCAALTALGTFLVTEANKGTFSGYFYDYLSPNVIGMATALFVLIQRFAVRAAPGLPVASVVMQRLSAASLGIYLVHALLLYILYKGWLSTWLTGIDLHPFLGVPVTSLAVLSVAYGITVLIKAVPVLRRIVP